MLSEGSAKTSCPSTGLAVPECSCRQCLEAMLTNFRPELLGGDIRIERTTGERDERPNVRPD